MLERAFSIDIQAAPQRVWDEITKQGGPCHPMFGTYLRGEMRPGERFSFESKDGKHTFVIGEVLEAQPPHRLVYTFRFSMESDPATLVVWELRESGGVTRVTVTHSRFPGETKTYKSVTSGWPRILALYKSQIEKGATPLGARLQNGMMSAMSFMLPKTARSEHARSLSLKLEEA
jgi:uncharacterized protein YndB with AHSA1/START domain